MAYQFGAERFGFSTGRYYADIWCKNISVTFWLSLDCWMLTFTRWGFSIGPLDVQWGD